MAALLVGWFAIGNGVSTEQSVVVPVRLMVTPTDVHSSDGGRIEVSMAEMLEIAETALERTVADVDDYTARMIKHEQDRSGVLQPPSEVLMKVVTRHSGGTPGGPMKVYMRFESPDEVRGREVIWVENENDGKMRVREAGMIGSMMTVSLEPDSFLAMRGQRYPITEVGLTRLLEKLIERGSEDRDDPNVHVFKTEGYRFENRELTLLQIEHERPNGRDDDFSLAELVLDRQNNVVVRFRSFGWPVAGESAPPLIESYEYHDLRFNVGLTPEDFQTTNPEYTFKQ